MSIRVGAASEAAATTALRVGGDEQTGSVHEGAGPSFSDVLEQTVGKASAAERGAMAKAEALAEGRLDDLHGTMITMKEAEISLKLVGSVRNKLLDAFHELWRINV